MLTAVDGQINGGQGTDKFRIKTGIRLATPVNLPPHSSASGFIGFPLPSIPRSIVKAVEYSLIVMPSEGQPALIPLILGEYDWKNAQ